MQRRREYTEGVKDPVVEPMEDYLRRLYKAMDKNPKDYGFERMFAHAHSSAVRILVVGDVTPQD